jgi:hypothetical protein
VAYAIVLLVVTAVSLVPQILRMRRLAQRMQREEPEWVSAWKRAGWSRKRRIARAMRHRERLYDPDDVRLMVGLSRRADLYQATAARRLWFSLPLVGALVLIAIVLDDPALAVQAVVVLGLAFLIHRVILPRQRARRHQTVAANRHGQGRF